VTAKQVARAEKLKGDFNIPPKRFYWLVIRALAKSKNWEELRGFSTRGASPVGLMPFVIACLEYGNKPEALQFVQRMREPSDRALAFARLDMPSEMLESAKGLKSEELLQRLYSMCRNPQAKASLQQMLEALQ